MIDNPYLAYPDRCYREIEECGTKKLKNGSLWFCSRSCELAYQYKELYPLIYSPAESGVEKIQ
jgi:hypothetical protein